MTTGETGQVTGTADKDYNLIWFTEKRLDNTLRLETYVQDAQRQGDTELAEFFAKAQAAAAQEAQLLAMARGPSSMANAHRAGPRRPDQAGASRPSRPGQNHAKRQGRRSRDRADSQPNSGRLPVLWQLDQLAETVTGEPETYLRYSLGPEADTR
jgi:hypothetical protein